MLSRSQVWATLVLVATFAAGAVVGGVVTHRGDDQRARVGRSNRPPDGQGDRRQGFAGYLTGELGLDSVQRDSVKAILKRYDPAMRQIMEGMRPRFDSVRTRIHADIMQVLTDSQRVEFQRIARRWRNEPPDRRRNGKKEEHRGR